MTAQGSTRAMDAHSFRLRDRVLDSPQLGFTVLVAAAMWLFFSATQNGYATLDNVQAIFQLAVPTALIALGLTVAIIAGEIDLSVGSMAALAGVLVVQLSGAIGPVPALLAGVAITTLLGALQGFVIARLRISSIVFTVGTLMLLRGASLLASGEKTVVLQDMEFRQFLTTRLAVVAPVTLIAIIIFVLVGAFLAYHRYGREIYAIGGARAEALAAGVPLTRPMVLVFALSGACAGLSGAFSSFQSGSAQPLGLQNLLLLGVVASFVGGCSAKGGKGSVFGAAFGTLTLQLLINGLNFQATPVYIAKMLWGALLLLVVVVEIGAQVIDRHQVRRAQLARMDDRREGLIERRRTGVAGAAATPADQSTEDDPTAGVTRDKSNREERE